VAIHRGGKRDNGIARRRRRPESRTGQAPSSGPRRRQLVKRGCCQVRQGRRTSTGTSTESHNRHRSHIRSHVTMQFPHSDAGVNGRTWYLTPLQIAPSARPVPAPVPAPGRTDRTSWDEGRRIFAPLGTGRHPRPAGAAAQSCQRCRPRAPLPDCRDGGGLSNPPSYFLPLTVQSARRQAAACCRGSSRGCRRRCRPRSWRA
jgi:hypothetical protein